MSHAEEEAHETVQRNLATLLSASADDYVPAEATSLPKTLRADAQVFQPSAAIVAACAAQAPDLSLGDAAAATHTGMLASDFPPLGPAGGEQAAGAEGTFPDMAYDTSGWDGGEAWTAAGGWGACAGANSGGARRFFDSHDGPYAGDAWDGFAEGYGQDASSAAGWSCGGYGGACGGEGLYEPDNERSTGHASYTATGGHFIPRGWDDRHVPAALEEPSNAGGADEGADAALSGGVPNGGKQG